MMATPFQQVRHSLSTNQNNDGDPPSSKSATRSAPTKTMMATSLTARQSHAQHRPKQCWRPPFQQGSHSLSTNQNNDGDPPSTKYATRSAPTKTMMATPFQQVRHSLSTNQNNDGDPPSSKSATRSAPTKTMMATSRTARQPHAQHQPKQ